MKRFNSLPRQQRDLIRLAFRRTVHAAMLPLNLSGGLETARIYWMQARRIVRSATP